MRAFRFRLDRVLDWYEKRYQEEENRVAQCLVALTQVRESIARLKAERVRVESDVIARATLHARDLVALGRYRLGAKRRESELNIERERRESALEQQRQRAQEARRRLKLLEKLRERRFSEFLYAENREIENLAAEAYTARWSQR